MRHLTILLLLTPGILKCQADNTQNSDKKFLSVSTNLIQLPINEFNIYIDYYFNKHSVGVNFSYIYPNSVLKTFYLSADQGNFPGTVWTGMGGRINYKYRYSERNFLALQLLYKNLSYRNEVFENLYHGNSNRFLRSEDAYLLGVDFIQGTHLENTESIFHFEIFYGSGLRYRERNYITFSSSANYFPNPKPVGTFTLKQFYPTLIFGLKIGLNFLRTERQKNNR